MPSRLPLPKRVDTEKGYVMVEFSHVYSCYIWRCEWGHLGFDFESEAEALDDFKKHRCDMSI